MIVIDIDEAPTGQPDNDTNSTSDNNHTGVNEPNPDNNSSQPTLPVFETYRPLVETGRIESLSETSVTLTASIRDNGGTSVSGRGFLISSSPNPMLNGPG